jgi:hypothetical protein
MRYTCDWYYERKNYVVALHKKYPRISVITEELKLIQLCGMSQYVIIPMLFSFLKNQVRDKIKQLQNKMELCNTLLTEFCFSNVILK